MLYVAEERTAGGRLFHALGQATANARSSIVDRRVVNGEGWPNGRSCVVELQCNRTRFRIL